MAAPLRIDDSSQQGYVFRGSLDLGQFPKLARWLAEAQPDPSKRWNMTAVERFDSSCALALWEVWGRRRPEQLALRPTDEALFKRIAEAGDQLDYGPKAQRQGRFGSLVGSLHMAEDLITLLGRFLLDLAGAITAPRSLPLREMSAAAYRAGVTGLPVVVIVGFLIGIVLSYLSSLQLREYGAESFLPLILGVGVVRELGPLLTAIVIAGRSGSSITAGIAAMRLTQELDALSALGISHTKRLVLPKTLALIVTVPLLVVCTNLAALIGGMVSGYFELKYNPYAFVLGLHRDVAPVHLYIGLFKATVFGAAIGLIACRYGLTARANTQSLATATTLSVVTSISAIIVLDALFAIAFKDISG